MYWPNHRESWKHPERECLMYNLLYSSRYHPGYDSSDADKVLEFASIHMLDFYKAVPAKTIDQSLSDYWWDLRIGRITASIIYEVVNCITPTGRKSLEDRILGYVNPSPETYATKRGCSLQKDVINVVGDKLNADLYECGLLLDPEYPAIGASPDAVGPNFVVEVKCPISQDNVINYVDSSTNSLRPKFYAQIQLQMHMKKVKFGYFVIAHSNFEANRKVDIMKIEYDESFTLKMIEEANKFWKKYIFPVMSNQI